VILILTRVLFRYFIKNRTHRFIDKLQDFVNSYKSTSHSSLAYTAPKDVNDNNQSDLWVYMYLKKQKLSKNSLKEPKKTKRHFIWCYLKQNVGICFCFFKNFDKSENVNSPPESFRSFFG
jgi:hypothetical protein